MKSIVLAYIMVLLWIPLFVFGAHFENLIDLTIKVEDASYTHRIKELHFNNQEIKLDPSDMFKPRKLVEYKLPPGRYTLIWTSEKSPTRWSEPPEKKIEKIVVLENGDGIVRINIKGDAISMY